MKTFKIYLPGHDSCDVPAEKYVVTMDPTHGERVQFIIQGTTVAEFNLDSIIGWSEV